MTLTAKDLVKKERILTAQPDDSLASALAKIHSSHDAVFVTENGRLLGLISPYAVLYRGHKPAGTKVKNCLFLAPKLKPDTKIDQIARLMLEAKVYFLPVVTATGKWLGVVSYRRLLRQLTGLKIAPKTVITCPETVTLSQVRNLMKKTGFSRLIIVTTTGRLSGIITRSDLDQTLELPPSTPAKNYIKRSVTTFGRHDNPDAIVNKMLDKNIGSAIMVNSNYQPIGLLSVRDCLEVLAHPLTPERAELFVHLTPVRSGFEALVRRGRTAAHAVGKFKKQALKLAFDRLNRQLERK